jgi:hypothetical protein
MVFLLSFLWSQNQQIGADSTRPLFQAEIRFRRLVSDPTIAKKTAKQGFRLGAAKRNSARSGTDGISTKP